MKFEMTIMKGVIQRQERQIEQLTRKVDDLTACQMASNITISGVLEEEEEICNMVVKRFLEENLEIEVQKEEIVMAHCIGVMDRDKEKRNRLMVVQCMPGLKDRVLANKNKLKGKENVKGKPYYINVQVPEAVASEKREIASAIHQIKSDNEGKPYALKTVVGQNDNKGFRACLCVDVVY